VTLGGKGGERGAREGEGGKEGQTWKIAGVV